MTNPLESLLKMFGGTGEPASTPGVPPPEVQVPSDLVFDDEPLEAVLYDESGPGPTSAGLFEQVRGLMAKIRTSKAANRKELLQAIDALLGGEEAVDSESFRFLAALARSFLPRWPEPPSPDMPPEVDSVLRGLWARALGQLDDDWRLIAGGLLWEWHELNGRHAEARDVLGALIAVEERRGNVEATANHENSLAFQFWLERRWSEAAAHFDRAARLAEETGDAVSRAQFMTNYQACRIEEGSRTDEAIYRSLRGYVVLLNAAKNLAGERKAEFYLATMDQARGDVGQAIKRLERAVAIDRVQNSIYLPADLKFLEELRKLGEVRR